MQYQQSNIKFKRGEIFLFAYFDAADAGYKFHFHSLKIKPFDILILNKIVRYTTLS